MKKYTRINTYKKDGIVTAMKFAIPSQIRNDSSFPFHIHDKLTMEIQGNSIIIKKVELLNQSQKKTFKKIENKKSIFKKLI